MMVRLRHRIVPSPAPGMTSPEPFQAQPSAAERAMSLHCFEKIRRTGWMKPAAVTRPSQPREHGREHPLVGANEETNKQDHRQGHRIGVRRPGRNRRPSCFILLLRLLALVLVIRSCSMILRRDELLLVRDVRTS